MPSYYTVSDMPDRYTDGVLSPDGKYFACGMYEHFVAYKAAVRELGIILDELDDAQEALEERYGWAHVSDGAVDWFEGELTQAQIDFLFELAKDAKPLWTRERIMVSIRSGKPAYVRWAP